MARGKLIVIDGSDGSGKATQTQLLTSKLVADGVAAQSLDFPRYKDNILGKLIGECIAGEHGDFLHVDPYIGSVLYASDRFESKNQIETWLSAGNVVILDRYVSANQLHQGGKIGDPEKRSDFLTWLDRLEYGVYGLPRPDLTVYLSMPLQHSIRLLQEKIAQTKKGDYLKGDAKDTVELDTTYLKNAQKSAELLMQTEKNWRKIVCAAGANVRTREDIHAELYGIVQEFLKR